MRLDGEWGAVIERLQIAELDCRSRILAAGILVFDGDFIQAINRRDAEAGVHLQVICVFKGAAGQTAFIDHMVIDVSGRASDVSGYIDGDGAVNDDGQLGLARLFATCALILSLTVGATGSANIGVAVLDEVVQRYFTRNVAVIVLVGDGLEDGIDGCRVCAAIEANGQRTAGRCG